MTEQRTLHETLNPMIGANETSAPRTCTAQAAAEVNALRTSARTLVLAGRAVAGGHAEGRVHLHAPTPRSAAPGQGTDAGRELSRLRAAMTAMEERMERIVEAGLSAGLEGRRSVLEAYRLFTGSKEWRERLEAAVATTQSAEAAVAAVQRETRARFDRIGDAYLREWLSDLDILANDMLRALLEAEATPAAELGPDAIVVAHALTAGELLSLEGRARAVVLANTSATAPAAVLAASLRIPVVCQVLGLDAARQGDRIFVDGDGGAVLLSRDPAEEAAEARGTPGGSAGWIEEALGPSPDDALRAMVGYGLNDEEIARYYGLDTTAIVHLRAFYGIGGAERQKPRARRADPARPGRAPGWPEGAARGTGGKGPAHDSART